ncbi:MAG: hypothetical protein WA005_01750 [Candidatus Binataceae bacterium]
MSTISARWHGFWATFGSLESRDEKSLGREVVKLIDYIILFIAVLALSSAVTSHRLANAHAAPPPGTSVASSSGHLGGM